MLRMKKMGFIGRFLNTPFQMASSHLETRTVNANLSPLGFIAAQKCVEGQSTTPQGLRFQSSHQIKNSKTSLEKLIWSNLMSVRHSPTPALTLGLAGLIPFVSVPLYIAMTGTFSASLAFAQAAYGASILSFLGGVRWGFSVAESSSSSTSVTWRDLGYSVTPSLIAWGSLLLPPYLCTMPVAFGLLFTAYSDVVMGGYPTWFKGLRLLLTFVAVLSLNLTLLEGGLALKKVKSSEKTQNSVDKLS